MKKYVGFFLLSTLFIGCAIMSNVKSSGDYQYIPLSDGTISITYYSGKNPDVVIPEKINGLIVTEIKSFNHYVNKLIGEEYFRNLHILTLTIPETVRKVRSSALDDCKNIKKIILMDSNVNSLEQLSIFEAGVFRNYRPIIEISPNRLLQENLFESKNIVSLRETVDFSNSPHSLSFSAILLFNSKQIFGPIDYSLSLFSGGGPVRQNIRENIQILENSNNDIFIFIKGGRSYSPTYDVFFNDTILISGLEIQDIKEINGNVFFIENRNGFRSLYKNEVKIFDGLPRLTSVIIDDNGRNIAHIIQGNDNTQILYLNSVEYFRTNPQVRSTINRIRFSSNGNNLVFIENFATREGNVIYININKKSFGPYRYIERDVFAEDSNYFIFRYNNGQGWIDERIQL